MKRKINTITQDKYYMADISKAILEAENKGLEIIYYNSYNPDEPHTTTQLYEAEYKDGMLTNEGEPYRKDQMHHVSVDIYQNGKEPFTQEATTIPDLVEILEYADTLDYTELVISGVFTSKSKCIRMVGKDE